MCLKFLVPQFTLDFLKKKEGCRLSAYLDTRNQWTIGYGTSFYPLEADILNNGKIRRVKQDEAAKEGDKITQEQAEDMLREYIERNCSQDVEDIKHALGKLTVQQITAIVSVSYNVCRPKFARSKCKKFIIKKDVVNACKEWNWGVKDGEASGLKKRRNEEIELFYRIKNYWK